MSSKRKSDHEQLSIKEVKRKFIEAETEVKDEIFIVPEELKMTLYALGKQIREGDCNKPKPPA